jgi:Fe-S cluster biogenesis protein NfuA
MFIQIEDTPNPLSLKFVLEKLVVESGRSLDFTKEKISECKNLNIRKILEIEGVEGIFVSANFITATKTDTQSWDVLKPQILSILMDFLTAGENFFEADTQNVRTYNTDLEKEIAELIDERVRPSVAMDGGDIQFEYFDEKEGIVYVSMKGSCSGCPSSNATLKDGIKRMLMYYVPEVKDVMPV